MGILNMKASGIPGKLLWSSRAVVPNLWYVYPKGYAKIILVMAENTHKKKERS
jgi:hypothetical protein